MVSDFQHTHDQLSTAVCMPVHELNRTVSLQNENCHQVSPRFELGSQDSESWVLTITPRDPYMYASIGIFVSWREEMGDFLVSFYLDSCLAHCHNILHLSKYWSEGWPTHSWCSNGRIFVSCCNSMHARLAQSVEHGTLTMVTKTSWRHPRVVGSSPTLGV